MNLSLPLNTPRALALSEAVDALADAGDVESRGAVFTRNGVVEALLDLCGYTDDAAIHQMRLLEPSCGEGDFLIPAIHRLLAAYRRSGAPLDAAVAELEPAIRAVELHRDTLARTAERVRATLETAGLTPAQSSRLSKAWLTHDDFLLTPLEPGFDVVVGNPPYVRQERIPAALLTEYRSRFRTLYDRADLYVLFYERGLDLLSPTGVLGFICANRWLKNKYGGPLRAKIAAAYYLKYFLDLERADAFDREVTAYPAITVIARGRPAATLVNLDQRDDAAGLSQVVDEMRGWPIRRSAASSRVTAISRVTAGDAPWLLDAPEVLTCLRDLESRLPTLEESGARVGIGVATGCDRVYVRPQGDLPVETSRTLPLAMASDLVDGGVKWGGRELLNPYLSSGALAPLAEFPRFAAYLREHEATLRARHTARQHPASWYRTIDRVYPELTWRPKLLIPDIKGTATVAYDEGGYYPHHNLYVVTSETWDLRALQAILRSSAALLFVAAYCVRMSGGFLRFQAQYLRRIRCPRPADLTAAQHAALCEVATESNQTKLDAVVLPLYGLNRAAAEEVTRFASAARVGPKPR